MRAADSTWSISSDFGSGSRQGSSSRARSTGRSSCRPSTATATSTGRGSQSARSVSRRSRRSRFLPLPDGPRRSNRLVARHEAPTQDPWTLRAAGTGGRAARGGHALPYPWLAQVGTSATTSVSLFGATLAVESLESEARRPGVSAATADAGDAPSTGEISSMARRWKRPVHPGRRLPPSQAMLRASLDDARHPMHPRGAI